MLWVFFQLSLILNEMYILQIDSTWPQHALLAPHCTSWAASHCRTAPQQWSCGCYEKKDLLHNSFKTLYQKHSQGRSFSTATPSSVAFSSLRVLETHAPVQLGNLKNHKANLEWGVAGGLEFKEEAASVRSQRWDFVQLSGALPGERRTSVAFKQ